MAITTTRTPRFLLRLAALAGAVAIALQIWAGAPMPTADDGPAATALRALITLPGDEAADALPADFETVLGYRPQVVDGELVRADGECSSPVPLPARFEPVCAQHDLGYDLLRFAGETGEPLGGWARPELDRMMGARMHQTCRVDGTVDLACSAAATVALTAVRANSVLQKDSLPEDTPVSVALFGAAGLVLVTGLHVLVTARRRNDPAVSFRSDIHLPRRPEALPIRSRTELSTFQ